jgi:ABC-2 type transport system permease protein
MVSFRRIYVDFKVFSVGYLRNKYGLFFGLIFPVILILIFGAIFSGDAGTTDIYAQNQDEGVFLHSPSGNSIGISHGERFLRALNESSTIRVITVDPSENFTDFLKAHSAEDGIVIPANFSKDYTSGQPVNVTVYGSPASSTSGIVIGTVNGYANYFNLQRYNGTIVIGVTQATANTQQTTYIDFLIPGLIGFSILTNPMFSLVNIAADYKKNKLFKQLSLTPLTKMEWLTAKVLFYIALSTAGFLLMAAVGVFAFGAHVTLSPWLIPFLILGPTLFASLGMLVGSIAKNPETAGVIGNIVTFPMMFLAGTFFPLSMMPEYLQTIARVLPLFYVTEGLNNVMVHGNISNALIDIAVLAIITAVIFLLAVKLFKWRED